MKCKNCRNIIQQRDMDGTLYHWCDFKADCPDKDLERACKYYVTASNADRIRSMDDDELTELLYAWHLSSFSKQKEWIHNWLKKKVQI